MKPQAIRVKLDKSDYIELKSSAEKKMKRQFIE